MSIKTPTYGLELEKAFVDHNAQPYAVNEAYFSGLADLYSAHGIPGTIKHLGGSVVGLATKLGEESLDSSFIHGESSTVPVAEADGGLTALNELVRTQFTNVLQSLEQQGAGVVSMSNSPLALINKESYEKTVAPKPVYDYLRNVRQWNHMAGANARSQNSPSVGIDAESATKALNVTLGFGPALIALYANSPFEQGGVASAKESRLDIWGQMFRNARFQGDNRLHRMPERPFQNMREYFKWMFADDTSMYFVVADQAGKTPKNEKGDVYFWYIDGNPNLLQFLGGAAQKARRYGQVAEAEFTPSMEHFAMHQFTQFTGGRIRFGLREAEALDPKDFLKAMDGRGDEVEDYFAKHGSFFYIEGREPGTNFADAELRATANQDVVDSVIISPAALHAGLIRNADEAMRAIKVYGWNNLRGLREEAIVEGLHGEYNGTRVIDVCHNLLRIAGEGLQSHEEWMLAYPEHVLQTMQNGADRAIARFNELPGSNDERVARVAKERIITSL